MTTTEYRVVGMTCENCERHVTEEVLELAGVTSAVAEAETGVLTVDSEEPLDRSAVREAVEEAGYELADA